MVSRGERVLQWGLGVDVGVTSPSMAGESVSMNDTLFIVSWGDKVNDPTSMAEPSWDYIGNVEGKDP